MSSFALLTNARTVRFAKYVLAAFILWYIPVQIFLFFKPHSSVEPQPPPRLPYEGNPDNGVIRIPEESESSANKDHDRLPVQAVVEEVEEESGDVEDEYKVDEAGHKGGFKEEIGDESWDDSATPKYFKASDMWGFGMTLYVRQLQTGIC